MRDRSCGHVALEAFGRALVGELSWREYCFIRRGSRALSYALPRAGSRSLSNSVQRGRSRFHNPGQPKPRRSIGVVSLPGCAVSYGVGAVTLFRSPH